MSVTTIHPILLCGGSGTRLWPISRKGYPKQFANVIGSSSLFKDSVTRLQGNGFAAPVVVTGDDLRFLVTEQLSDVGQEPDVILVEPSARNTAPAVLAAALWLEGRDPDSLMLVTPSDHVIPDEEEFRKAIDIASEKARDGAILTFGIAPTRPETGYGWLELNSPDDKNSLSPQKLVKFVEKPSVDVAQEMLDADRFLWNAGIFLFSVGTILKAYRALEPEMVEHVSESLKGAEGDLDFLRLEDDSWNRIPEESIDYAIMERVDNLFVMPFNKSWSDLGGWEAVWLESGPDADGNAVSENALALGCKHSLLRSESQGQELVGIGLENIVAVTMPDAVLVANMSDNQRVKEAVKVLKERGKRQAEDFPRDHRPWGWFESLAIGGRFQVKRIVVKPGGILSLQSHNHRSEHWIVVEGTARVTIDDEVKLVTENQSVYIPLGAVHRMENPGKVPMVLIEVQTGSYLGEDDIIRYEDAYSRK